MQFIQLINRVVVISKKHHLINHSGKNDWNYCGANWQFVANGKRHLDLYYILSRLSRISLSDFKIVGVTVPNVYSCLSRKRIIYFPCILCGHTHARTRSCIKKFCNIQVRAFTAVKTPSSPVRQMYVSRICRVTRGVLLAFKPLINFNSHVSVTTLKTQQ